MKEVSLEIKNVAKRFNRVYALQDVTFDIKKGQVHVLCGENGAGKSTLMKILSGELEKDDGIISLNGSEIHWRSPYEALKKGISMIAQELHPLLEMTVAENIFLGREFTWKGIFVDKKVLYERAKKTISSLGLKLDETKKMKELSLAQMQLVEIAKAVSYDSDVIIMDEPTSAIGEIETKQLFEIIRRLKSEEKTIIYISHRMKEIFEIGDAVTVLRDGRHIITTSLADFSQEELVAHMIGKKIDSSYFVSPKPLNTNKVFLKVDKFTHKKKNKFNNISFSLHEKEILGIFGLVGSSRSSFLEALFGVTSESFGEVYLKGKKVEISSPSIAIKNGIACVTEDRKFSGLVTDHTIKENINLPSLTSILKNGFLKNSKEISRTKEIISRFNIKAASMEQKVVNLSGGNQQKVVLGKWVLTRPNILLLDEPTRGVDIGAKQEIYQFMNEFVSNGGAIIMVSSELPEVLAMSHRVLIFKKGEVVAERSRVEFNQEEFMRVVS